MTKAQKAHGKHTGRLEKMQARRSELQESYQQAQDALKLSGFGDALIEGKPVDKLAADLSRHLRGRHFRARRADQRRAGRC